MAYPVRDQEKGRIQIRNKTNNKKKKVKFPFSNCKKKKFCKSFQKKKLEKKRKKLDAVRTVERSKLKSQST